MQWYQLRVSCQEYWTVSSFLNSYHIKHAFPSFWNYTRVTHDGDVSGGVKLLDSSCGNRRLLQVVARCSLVRTVSEEHNSLKNGKTENQKRVSARGRDDSLQELAAI